MVTDLRGMIGALGSSAGEIQNLSVAALLNKISKDGTPAQQSALQNLMASFATKV